MNKIFPQISKHIGVVESFDIDSGHGIVSCSDERDSDLQKQKVAFCLTGEKILFDKLKYRRATYYTFAKVIENPNTQRVEQKCPHFTICGGCLFQHMSDALYREHKLKKVKNILHHYQEKITDLIVIPSGLRRKANFEAIKKQDKIYLGFHRFNSRQIINLETCRILRQEIVSLIEPLKKLLMEILNEFDKAEFFITLAENGLDVGLEIQNVKFLQEEKKIIIQQFGIENGLQRFTFRHGKKFDEIFCANEKPYLKFASYKVSINPWSFMQTSKEAESAMLGEMQNMLNLCSKKDSCIDLFSGRGTYTLSLIHNFRKIKAVELSEESISALNEVKDLYDLPIESEIRNLFEKPVESRELNEFDVAIINPPRAGAESQSIELAKSNVKNILYVSCNPETFARDLKILENKYRLIDIKVIDQFIWSNHLEVIGFFELK